MFVIQGMQRETIRYQGTLDGPEEKSSRDRKRKGMFFVISFIVFVVCVCVLFLSCFVCFSPTLPLNIRILKFMLFHFQDLMF